MTAVWFLLRHHQRERRPALAAMSLVEVMVAVAVSSVLVGVVTSLLLSLKDRDATTRSRGVRNESLIRLADTLRIDIRHAKAVTMPTSNKLRIEFPLGLLVDYNLTDEGCQRTVTTTDSQTATELYRIGPASEWSLDDTPSDDYPLFTVTILSVNDTNNAPRNLPFIVQAALGADQPPN